MLRVHTNATMTMRLIATHGAGLLRLVLNNRLQYGDNRRSAVRREERAPTDLRFAMKQGELQTMRVVWQPLLVRLWYVLEFHSCP